MGPRSCRARATRYGGAGHRSRLMPRRRVFSPTCCQSRRGRARPLSGSVHLRVAKRAEAELGEGLLQLHRRLPGGVGRAAHSGRNLGGLDGGYAAILAASRNIWQR
jgi:hypothetical protein